MAADLTYTTSACIEATWSGSPYTACAKNGEEDFPESVHYHVAVVRNINNVAENKLGNPSK